MVLWESIVIYEPILYFTYVRNPGIAFGISVGDYQAVVALLSFAATVFIAYMHWNERRNHPLIVQSFSLILGGAIGNMIDRSYVFFSDDYKGVIDFINIGTSNFRWYTFNIADTAVTIGIILYILHSLIEKKIDNSYNDERAI